jgi:hypothetical protein
MVAISQNRAAEGSLHFSIDQASVIQTVYWIRQEPNCSSVSVMDSMEGAMERRWVLVALTADAEREGAGL